MHSDQVARLETVGTSGQDGSTLDDFFGTLLSWGCVATRYSDVSLCWNGSLSSTVTRSQDSGAKKKRACTILNRGSK